MLSPSAGTRHEESRDGVVVHAQRRLDASSILIPSREVDMTASWRFSALADRHRALGSALQDWNGMGTAWSYDKDMAEEHVAIRTKAGLMDVSGLKKVHLVGPHAAHVLDLATTRDVHRIYPGRSAYACMLNDAGKFTEDCIVYRVGPTAWF
ncbi:MAG TPA: hypothetical protein VM344_03175, partial [Vitreimonas sp.]|nr:hypothetical protein [Vitreimonas sp.]